MWVSVAARRRLTPNALGVIERFTERGGTLYATCIVSRSLRASVPCRMLEQRASASQARSRPRCARVYPVSRVQLVRPHKPV